jgi:hypothetical protein
VTPWVGGPSCNQPHVIICEPAFPLFSTVPQRTAGILVSILCNYYILVRQVSMVLIIITYYFLFLGSKLFKLERYKAIQHSYTVIQHLVYQIRESFEIFDHATLGNIATIGIKHIFID